MCILIAGGGLANGRAAELTMRRGANSSGGIMGFYKRVLVST